ncbi:MAG: RsmD family RNA methyltransferase [Opitutaceae bacterium]|jgi:16S rRNA (guanine966-N2)-methyltransferase|nr:RsmD family RNA methyltransferase [Opitutaceae bacterium]
MRISGGAARGVTLGAPGGTLVRPATDRLRQAVFSSLAAVVPGAVFADLFAGSGSYGLEAFSRGASGGVFVERNTRALACLRQNIAAVCKSARRGAESLRTLPMDALAWRGGDGAPPDLVFADPPYAVAEDVADALFANIAEATRGKPGAVVVFELPGEMELRPAGWRLVRRLGGGARQPSAAFFARE